MKRFTRLSLGFSKKLENLGAAVALHVAYFNYCWRSRENNGGRTAAHSGDAGGHHERTVDDGPAVR